MKRTAIVHSKLELPCAEWTAGRSVTNTLLRIAKLKMEHRCCVQGFVESVNEVRRVTPLPISNDDTQCKIHVMASLSVDIISPQKQGVYPFLVTRLMDQMIRCASGPVEAICRMPEGSAVYPGDSVMLLVTDIRYGLDDTKILCLADVVAA